MPNAGITGVRVERLNDCSREDAYAEGVDGDCGEGASIYWVDDYFGPIKTDESPQACYKMLWESINGTGSWDANPWVWVIEFRRVQP